MVKNIRKAVSTHNLVMSADHLSISSDFTPSRHSRLSVIDTIPMRDQLRSHSQSRDSSAAAAPAPASSSSSSTRRAFKEKDALSYCKPFCDFLHQNPTVFHAVDAVASDLRDAGFTKLSARDEWKLKRGGKYYVERNGSSLIAFEVGAGYEGGNGVAMLAGHVDALTAKLKPIPKLRSKAGYQMLGIAPYAGALNKTWWDRDLGIGGRVLVKDGGKIVTKLVKLDWPSNFPERSHHGDND
jgi:aminopeptidase I